jgi:hypothetical protein
VRLNTDTTCLQKDTFGHSESIIKNTNILLQQIALTFPDSELQRVTFTFSLLGHRNSDDNVHNEQRPKTRSLQYERLHGFSLLLCNYLPRIRE